MFLSVLRQHSAQSSTEVLCWCITVAICWYKTFEQPLGEHWIAPLISLMHCHMVQMVAVCRQLGTKAAGEVHPAAISFWC